MLWHWFITVFWVDESPPFQPAFHPYSWLSLVSWICQAMPAYFVALGAKHEAARARNTPSDTQLSRMLRQLLGGLSPAMVLVGGWFAARLLLSRTTPEVVRWWWLRSLDEPVFGPLTWILLFVLLIPTRPVMLHLHDRFGLIMPVILAALATAADATTYEHGPATGHINTLLVWLCVQQIGFFWGQLRGVSRQTRWAVFLGGFSALAALTLTDIYPIAMEGSIGWQTPNISQPTITVIALAVGQLGAMLLIEPRYTARRQAGGQRRLSRWFRRNAFAWFLWHAAGYATYAVVVLHNFRGLAEPPWNDWRDAQWLWFRPVTLPLIALATLPYVLVYMLIRKLTNRRNTLLP